MELRIEKVHVDGAPPSKDILDPGFLVGRADRLEEPNWESLVLDLVVATPPDEVAEFEREAVQDLRVAAVALCRETEGRQSILLSRSPDDPSLWSGSLRLDRSVLRGKVEVHAVLGGSMGRSEARWLGESAAWAIYMDEPEVPPIEGVLRVKWTRFKGEGRNQNIPENAQDESFYVALLEDPPVVYLNEDFEHLPDLLSDDPSRPAPEKALREAEFRRIATAAWVEMFQAAVVAIDFDEETGEASWPSGEWRKSALKHLLPEVYPDMGELEALAQAYKDFRSEEALHLLGLLQVAIGKKINASKSLRRGIRRVLP